MNKALSHISGLFARIRARLRSWLQPSGPSQPAPAALPASTAPPAAPIAAASAASASVASASVASASVASASVDSASVASASVASASVDSGSMVSEISAASLSLAREAANSPVRPQVAAAPAALAMPGDGRIGVQVRQFFARMASAGPGGLVVDFATWGPVPVERFFMALGAAERGERRGPALADASSIGEAFQGFVWD